MNMESGVLIHYNELRILGKTLIISLLFISLDTSTTPAKASRTCQNTPFKQ